MRISLIGILLLSSISAHATCTSVANSDALGNLAHSIEVIEEPLALGSLAAKFNAGPSFRALQEELISPEEFEILSSLVHIEGRQIPPNLLKYEMILKEIMKTVKQIEAKTQIFDPHQTLQVLEKVNNHQPVSAHEIKLIVQAKHQWLDVYKHEGSVVSLPRFADRMPHLKALQSLAQANSPQIDEALNQDAVESHQKNANSHPLTTLIQGAGPSGLLSAFAQFQAGAKVIVVNNRSEEYSRDNIYRIDPKSMSHLQALLGSKFVELFAPGSRFGKTTTDGIGEIPIKRLEDALKQRLVEIASYSRGSDIELLYEHDLEKISEPTSDSPHYQAVLKTPQKKTQLIPVDLVDFAGGVKNPLKDQYLQGSVPVTQSKIHVVPVWEKKSPESRGLASYLKNDNYSVVLTPGEVSQLINTDDFKQIIREAHLPEEKIAHYLERVEKIAHDPSQIVHAIQLENSATVSVGSSLPPVLESLVKDAQLLISKSTEPAAQAKLKELVSQVQQNWNTILKNHFTHTPEHLVQSAYTGQLWPLDQQQSRETIKVLSKNGSRLIVTAVGDSLVTPHFFTFSGASSEREAADGLANAVQKYHRDHDIESLAQSVQQTNEAVQQKVIHLGSKHLPRLDVE